MPQLIQSSKFQFFNKKIEANIFDAVNFQNQKNFQDKNLEKKFEFNKSTHNMNKSTHILSPQNQFRIYQNSLQKQTKQKNFFSKKFDINSIINRQTDRFKDQPKDSKQKHEKQNLQFSKQKNSVQKEQKTQLNNYACIKQHKKQPLNQSKKDKINQAKKEPLRNMFQNYKFQDFQQYKLAQCNNAQESINQTPYKIYSQKFSVNKLNLLQQQSKKHQKNYLLHNKPKKQTYSPQIFYQMKKKKQNKHKNYSNFLSSSNVQQSQQKNSKSSEPIYQQKICTELFEQFILILITSLNPFQCTEEDLIPLNKNFEVFQTFLNTRSNHQCLLLYGVQSTGKSFSIDYAIKKHQSFRKLSIQCLKSDSQVSFIDKLNQIFEDYFQTIKIIKSQFDQFDKKSLFTHLQKIITNQPKKKTVLVIQNSQLLMQFKAHKVLYNLLNLAERCSRNFKVILVTKQINIFSKLDRRQKSRIKYVKLQMLKYGAEIVKLFQSKIEKIYQKISNSIQLEENQIGEELTNKSRESFTYYKQKLGGQKFEQIINGWLNKTRQIFCHNQNLNKTLQTYSKRGIERHLNASCWIISHFFGYQTFQLQSLQFLKFQVNQLYKEFVTDSHPLPAINLLKNSNLDQKIFMAIAYRMLHDLRRPYNFNNLLRISYELKTQYIHQKLLQNYLTQNVMKKAFHKLLDKKIIYFQEKYEQDYVQKQMSFQIIPHDIKQLIISDVQDQDQHIPRFVKNILCEDVNQNKYAY